MKAVQTKVAEEKIDRRVVRSRAAIVSAFERLVVSQPLEKITVSAVAREADVDRKTFYQHFGSIEGLLHAICDQVVVSVVDEVEREVGGAGKGGASRETTVHAFFSAIGHAVCSNIVVNRRLFESIPSEVLISDMRVPLERELMARGLIKLDVPEEVTGYYFSYALGGILAVYRTWLTSGGDVPIEEVSQIATRLALDGIADLAI